MKVIDAYTTLDWHLNNCPKCKQGTNHYCDIGKAMVKRRKAFDHRLLDTLISRRKKE